MVVVLGVNALLSKSLHGVPESNRLRERTAFYLAFHPKIVVIHGPVFRLRWVLSNINIFKLLNPIHEIEGCSVSLLVKRSLRSRIKPAEPAKLQRKGGAIVVEFVAAEVPFLHPRRFKFRKAL
eukprot:XP_001708856.1 Hypothetical protein GL50803_32429 [Giardia lamblia ATCC 50803]